MRLKHRICLVRTKGPFNFFCIKLIPEIPLAMEGREMERISIVQMCVFFLLIHSLGIQFYYFHSQSMSYLCYPSHYCISRNFHIIKGLREKISQSKIV